MIAARDNAADAIVDATRCLQPLINHRDDTVKARAGIALYRLQYALRSLEYAGAGTRPTDEGI